MGIRSWLREKWNLMLPGQAYILGMYGTPMDQVNVPHGVAYQYQLNSRAPFTLETGWIVQWQWLGLPMLGVTMDHPDSTYTVLRFAADAPPGFGRIAVVYTRPMDGAVFYSKPMAVRILPPAVQTNAGI